MFPSLLDARYFNQTQSIRNAELFEVATIYLPGQDGELPSEKSTLGIVTAGDLQRIKGVVESILQEVGAIVCTWEGFDHDLLEAGTGQKLSIDGKTLGYLGLVSKSAQNHFSLDAAVAAAELDVMLLTDLLEPVRRANQVSAFPAMERDLNFVVDESVRWASLEDLCLQHGGEILETVNYRETYRDTKKDGKGKKRLLLTLVFRSLERTLTGEEVEKSVQDSVNAAGSSLEAKLLA